MAAYGADRLGDVRAARKLLHLDFKARWLTDLPEAQHTELDIATLLDPRFKTRSLASRPSSMTRSPPRWRRSRLSAAWAAN